MARDAASVRVVWRGGEVSEFTVALTVNALAALPRAAEMEARVLARISAGPSARTGLHVGAVIVAALAIGLAGGGVPATASEAASLSPLTGGSPLAPSTLLTGAP